MHVLLALFVWLQVRLSSVTQPSSRLANPLAARAAGFVEYAMLAAIAIAIFLIFREGLAEAFGDIVDDIDAIINGNDVG